MSITIKSEKSVRFKAFGNATYLLLPPDVARSGAKIFGKEYMPTVTISNGKVVLVLREVGK